MIEEWLKEISMTVGIIGSVLAWPVFKWWSTWFRKHRQKKTDRLVEVIEKANQPMINAYKREHETLVKEIAGVKEGSLAILHDSIYDKGDYYNERGYATIDEIENFDHLWRAYHDTLGGNGTGEVINNHVRELPIRNGKTAYTKEAVEMHKEREVQK